MKITGNIIEKIERVNYNNHFADLYQDSVVSMGFTEIGFNLEELPHLLNSLNTKECVQMKELKQIHGNIIFHSRDI